MSAYVKQLADRKHFRFTGAGRVEEITSVVGGKGWENARLIYNDIPRAPARFFVSYNASHGHRFY